MTTSGSNGFAGLGWGLAVPDSVLKSSDLEKRLGLADGWMVRRTGIVSRPIAAPHLATSDLAVMAGEEALVQADVEPDSKSSAKIGPGTGASLTN